MFLIYCLGYCFLFPQGVGDFTGASWHPSGHSFCTCHVDGMITFWDCSDLNNPTVETKKHYGNHGNAISCIYSNLFNKQRASNFKKSVMFVGLGRCL